LSCCAACETSMPTRRATIASRSVFCVTRGDEDRWVSADFRQRPLGSV
jgi:hypothetical protein